jgi:hypothetical protein
MKVKDYKGKKVLIIGNQPLGDELARKIEEAKSAHPELIIVNCKEELKDIEL